MELELELSRQDIEGALRTLAKACKPGEVIEIIDDNTISLGTRGGRLKEPLCRTVKFISIILNQTYGVKHIEPLTMYPRDTNGTNKSRRVRRVL